MQTRALELAKMYDRLNDARGQAIWTGKDLALGLMGDVGDLAKAVQSLAGDRTMSDPRSRLEHEIVDCLWSILVLADRLEVDLQQAFEVNMTALEEKVSAELAAETRPGDDRT